MEENYSEDLKASLFNALDMETNKVAAEINTDKVEAIVQLLEMLEPENVEIKNDSLKKFIHKFNVTHNTNFTADKHEFTRREKKYKYFILFILFALILSGRGIFCCTRKLLEKNKL